MTEYRWRKSSRSTGGSECVEVAVIDSGVARDSNRWRKSSRSTGDSECVEVALIDSGAVRDSKNPAGPVLAVDLPGLLAAVRGGLLDR